ncbi:MAG: hypothetical protein U0893_26955 [Chloroflexota bacterium]
MVASLAILAGIGRAQGDTPTATLVAAQGQVIVTRSSGAVQTGSVGMTVGAGDRIAVPGSGRATLRLFDGSELLLFATTTVDLDKIAGTSDGSLYLTATQSQGLTASHVAAGHAAEIRVESTAANAVALLERGGMVVRTDDGTNNVTVACEDRTSLVFFPYEDRAMRCEQSLMRTLTSDGDVVDSVVARGVPVVVAVFGGDQLGRGPGTSARIDHEEKESVALSGDHEPITGGIGPPATPTPVLLNDLFSAAIPFSPAGSSSVNTRAATTESGEPTPTCGIVGKTVWYRLLALTTRTVTITTQGSTFDTVIAVYQGPSLGTLTQRACNDQDPGQPSVPGTSSLTVSLTAGQEYWLQVGGALGAGGDLVVTVR